jgi:hypothetical protein
MGEVWKDKQPPMDTKSYFQSFAVFDTTRISSTQEIDVLDAFEYLHSHLREETARMQQGKVYDVFEMKYESFCSASGDAEAPTGSEKVKDSFLRLTVDSKTDTTLSLTDLLKQYFQAGESCGDTQRATRLLKPPRILALAVDADRAGTSVTIPGNLELSQALSQSRKAASYRLVGAIYREETGGGLIHYVADYYNAKHKLWIHTDDATTYPIQSPPESIPLVRMLFYLHTN